MLAIEVLAPSTRRFDLMTKRSRHEAAGTWHYWVVDPDEPSLTAWAPDDAVTYAEVAHVTGDEVFEAAVPVPVQVIPGQLVAERT